MYCINRRRIAWIAGTVVAAWLGWQILLAPVYGQPEGTAVQRQGSWMALQLPGDSTGDRVVIIDSQQRSLAVYHIGREQGKIRLESMRNIESDLRMTSFNSHAPLPEEIRLNLERR